MFVKFIAGIGSYFKALSFISRHGMLKYFIFSGLIGLGSFGFWGILMYNLNPVISSFLNSLIPVSWDLSLSITDWISGAFSLAIFFTVFKYLMLIFTAPLMSVLSEKVEKEITGYTYNKSIVLNIIPDLLRGLRINLRNIIKELFFTLLLMLFGFVPVVGIAAGFLIILIQGYYAGFGNFDFWAERQFSYSETVEYMKRKKGMLTGNGIVYVFLLAIPILGAFIAPPLATVAATMEGIKDLENSNYYSDEY